MPEELVQAFKPDYVAPLVALLCSDKLPHPSTGGLFEVGSGWVARTRWQRSGGYDFPLDRKLTPEAVTAAWDKILDFDDGRADHPEDAQDGLKRILRNMQSRTAASKKSGNKSRGSGKPAKVDQAILDSIERAKKAEPEACKFSYDERDVIIYSMCLLVLFFLARVRGLATFVRQISASVPRPRNCI
jgi:multifunctional beta-oxidation protein